MNIFSADYERFSQEMENEFLALGKRLSKILKQSQAISEKAAKVYSQMGGFELNKAEDHLKRFQKQVESMGAGSKHRFALISGILDAFMEIDRLMKSLRQSAESLSPVCAAANDAVFHNQQERDACEKRVHGLEDMGIAINKQFDEFGCRISQTREEIRKSMMAALQKEQHRSHQSNMILDQVFSGIELLRDKHRISADILHHFSIRYRAIFKNIGDIVECLQFHDITRQRIQRSSSAIREIESRLVNPAMTAEASGIEKVVAISQIQVIQLYQAKAGLEYAARTIANSLKNLSFDIHEIISTAKNLGKLTGRYGDSFLDNIERNLSSLQIATKDLLATGREAAVSQASVSRNMETLAVLCEDIMKMGNCIKSAILSASGDEKISGASESSLGFLFVDAQNHVTEMEHAMHRVYMQIQCITSLMCELNRKKEEDARDPLNEMGALDNEFEVMIQQLQDGNSYAEGALAEVEIISAALLDAVIEASQFFKYPEVLLQEIEKVCQCMETHIQKAESHIRPKQLWESGRNRRNAASSDTTHENGKGFNSEDELSEPCSKEGSWDHAAEAHADNQRDKIALNPFGGSIELF